MKPTWLTTILVAALAVSITLQFREDRIVYIPSPMNETLAKNNNLLTEQVKSHQRALNELRIYNSALQEQLRKKPKVVYRTVRDTVEVPAVYEWKWGDRIEVDTSTWWNDGWVDSIDIKLLDDTLRPIWIDL